MSGLLSEKIKICEAIGNSREIQVIPASTGQEPAPRTIVRSSSSGHTVEVLLLTGREPLSIRVR